MPVEDTHPEARRRQIELLRAATPAQRFAAASELTDFTRSLTLRALARRHPDGR